MLRYLDNSNPNWERYDLDVINEIIGNLGPIPVFPIHLEDCRLDGRIQLVDTTAALHRFFRKGYGWTTVQQYYRHRHGIVLRWPNLPLVQIGRNRGRLFPIELLEF